MTSSPQTDRATSLPRHPGVHISLRTAGCQIAYHNAVAQDLLVLVDADPRVRAVRPGEPVTFHRPSDGEPQTFTPDLEVEYDDGVHIITCRPWEALDRAVTQDELIWKILLEHYRNELVLHKLYILTPEDLPATRVQQARHFAGFHGQPPHPEIHRATLGFLGEQRHAVPLPHLRRHLQEILIRPPDPEQISGTLYGMLGRGELAAEPGVLAPNCAVSRPGPSGWPCAAERACPACGTIPASGYAAC